MRRRLPLASKTFVSLALFSGVTFFGTNTVSAQQVTQMSAASDGSVADAMSYEPVISADGRFVAFTSLATNLVPNDTNGEPDVFVKDRVTNAIERISVRANGDQATHGSSSPRISADGRFVAFDTLDPLVAADTTVCSTVLNAPCMDTYVVDRQTHEVTLVTLSTTGEQANTESFVRAMSADGRFVLFSSSASNLVINDTNGFTDLFLRDRQLSTTIRVSLDLTGGQIPVQSHFGLLSADGRFIVYNVRPVADGQTELALLERETGQVSLLSATFPELNLPAVFAEYAAGPSHYLMTHISADGRVVAAMEQIPGAPSPRAVSPIQRYLLHDRVTGQTITSEWHDFTGMEDGRIIALSGDGRTSGVASQHGFAVELVDRVGGLRELVPGATSIGAYTLSLSADSRFAAFSPNPQNGTFQRVYLYDRDSGDGDGMPSAWETLFGLNPTNLTDANADADLDGVTNLQEFLRGTHPSAVASATRYFAEGAANAFFTTRLAALNPGDQPAAVVFRFLGSSGQTSSVTRAIAARSRITLELAENGLAPANDFSTVIESDRTVVVDRTMTWDHTGYGAHAETAITAPSTTWYLAEGATHGAFDLFYLLQNPNDSRAHTTVTYLRQAPLGPVTRTYQVEPNSRKTIAVDGEGPELDAVDTAASITSDLPIVVERAMYSTRPDQPAFAAGHGAAGVASPALRWFLAEGATGNFFDTYVLVGNPNATQSDLKVTYLLPEGAPFDKLYHVGPQQRLTIYVQDEDPRLANTPVSVIVDSTNNQPVVVERAMWWPKGEWHEAHVSAGATTTGTKWALADGEVTVDGDTYILIANTSATAGTATVTLLEESGTPVTVTVDLPASSRVNVPVSAHLPLPEGGTIRRFGALIESNGVEIVVERSIYTTAGGITWGAGTSALGTKLQ